MKRQSGGFTIIETLIVLAIAGLILAIVFEAIPALSRNSRNNQRRQDAQAILQAVARFEFNNSGNFPPACGTGSPLACRTGVNTSLLYYTHLSYYDATTNVITVHQPVPGGAHLTPAANFNNIDIYNYEVCDPNAPGTAISTGADYTNIVALYGIETGGTGAAEVCDQL